MKSRPEPPRSKMRFTSTRSYLPARSSAIADSAESAGTTSAPNSPRNSQPIEAWSAPHWPTLRTRFLVAISHLPKLLRATRMPRRVAARDRSVYSDYHRSPFPGADPMKTHLPLLVVMTVVTTVAADETPWTVRGHVP